jgi:hypothetical protein
MLHDNQTNEAIARSSVKSRHSSALRPGPLDRDPEDWGVMGLLRPKRRSGAQVFDFFAANDAKLSFLRQLPAADRETAIAYLDRALKPATCDALENALLEVWEQTRTARDEGIAIFAGAIARMLGYEYERVHERSVTDLIDRFERSTHGGNVAASPRGAESPGPVAVRTVDGRIVETSLIEATVYALKLSLSEAASRFKQAIDVVSMHRRTFTVAEGSAALTAAADATEQVAVAIQNAAAATIAPMAAAGLDAQDPALRFTASLSYYAYREAAEVLARASSASTIDEIIAILQHAHVTVIRADSCLDELDAFLNDWSDVPLGLSGFSVAPT